MKLTYKLAIQLFKYSNGRTEFCVVGRDCQIEDVALSEFHHTELPNGDVTSNLEDGTLLYTNDPDIVNAFDKLSNMCSGTITV